MQGRHDMRAGSREPGRRAHHRGVDLEATVHAVDRRAEDHVGPAQAVPRGALRHTFDRDHARIVAADEGDADDAVGIEHLEVDIALEVVLEVERFVAVDRVRCLKGRQEVRVDRDQVEDVGLVPRHRASGRVLEPREEVVGAVRRKAARRIGEAPERGGRGRRDGADGEAEPRGRLVEGVLGVEVEVDPTAQRRIARLEGDHVARVRREARRELALADRDEVDRRIGTAFVLERDVARVVRQVEVEVGTLREKRRRRRLDEAPQAIPRGAEHLEEARRERRVGRARLGVAVEDDAILRRIGHRDVHRSRAVGRDCHVSRSRHQVGDVGRLVPARDRHHARRQVERRVGGEERELLHAQVGRIRDVEIEAAERAIPTGADAARRCEATERRARRSVAHDVGARRVAVDELGRGRRDRAVNAVAEGDRSARFVDREDRVGRRRDLEVVDATPAAREPGRIEDDLVEALLAHRGRRGPRGEVLAHAGGRLIRVLRSGQGADRAGAGRLGRAHARVARQPIAVPHAARGRDAARERDHLDAVAAGVDREEEARGISTRGVEGRAAVAPGSAVQRQREPRDHAAGIGEVGRRARTHEHASRDHIGDGDRAARHIDGVVVAGHLARVDHEGIAPLIEGAGIVAQPGRCASARAAIGDGGVVRMREPIIVGFSRRHHARGRDREGEDLLVLSARDISRVDDVEKIGGRVGHVLREREPTRLLPSRRSAGELIDRHAREVECARVHAAIDLAEAEDRRVRPFVL